MSRWHIFFCIIFPCGPHEKDGEGDGAGGSAGIAAQ